jgi:hypothetical protein
MTRTNHPITITGTQFVDFIVADAVGRLSRVRETQRQYERYLPEPDFYAGFRDGLEQLHRDDADRSELSTLYEQADGRRSRSYRSACDGYAKFWQGRAISVVARPRPVIWASGRLRVRLSPDFVYEIDGEQVIVELHLRQDLPVDQRHANPLLSLLHDQFGAGRDGSRVGLLDVHRGKLFHPTDTVEDLDTTMLMEAAAFTTGWEVIERRREAA